METIKISERKLKIMLTEEDLSEYDLSVPVDVTSSFGRERLRRILRDACGGKSLDRAFVQIYESNAGGCELFVTQYEKFRPGEVKMTPRVTAPKTRTERGIYAFRDFNSLLAACGRLSRPGRLGSAVYADREGGYYLLTYESESKLDAICGEYGGQRCGRAADAYLAEHCDCICKGDAVGILGALL